MDTEERGAPDAGVSRRRILTRVGASAGLAGLALGLAGRLPATPAAAQSRIAGTWLITGVGAPRPVAFLWVFFPEGILLSFQAPVGPTTHPGDAPDAAEWQSPGAGSWIEGPGDTIRVSFVALDYDGPGNAIARDDVEGTLQYDHATDTWQASVTITETDLDGNFVAANTYRTAATRIGGTG
jgi:hypothetical protein